MTTEGTGADAPTKAIDRNGAPVRRGDKVVRLCKEQAGAIGFVQDVHPEGAIGRKTPHARITSSEVDYYLDGNGEPPADRAWWSSWIACSDLCVVAKEVSNG